MNSEVVVAAILLVGLGVVGGVRLWVRDRALAMARPRVIFLTTHLGLGGLERMILNLSRGLKNWDPIIFVYDDDDAGGYTLHSEFRKSGIPVVSMKKQGRGVSFAVVWAIAREAVARRALFIHSHDLGALTYAVFAKWLCFSGVRVINTQHSFVHLDRKWTYRYLEWFFTQSVDSKLAVSEALRAQYATIRVNPDEVKVIPNGVQFPTRPALSAEDLRARRAALIAEVRDADAARRLRARADTIWVLCMARVHPRKGQDHVIDLWTRLSDSVRGRATLVLVGSETTPGTLCKLLERARAGGVESSVIYAGATHGPADWLVGADVYASGSEFEGMPLGPIEAVGAGLELLVSDIPGHSMLPDFVNRFSLEDKARGARQLESIIDRVSAEGQRAQGWERGGLTRQRFGIDAMASEYEKTYSDLA